MVAWAVKVCPATVFGLALPAVEAVARLSRQGESGAYLFDIAVGDTYHFTGDPDPAECLFGLARSV